MATIYEVARRAGVSAATVSRVVNGRSGIGSETRRRVEAVMEAEGFQPRWKAPVGQAVGFVIFPHPGCLSHPYNAHLISAACETLWAQGFFVHLIPGENTPHTRANLRRLLVAHQIQGVLVLALHPTYDVARDLDSTSVPHVALGALPADSPHFQASADDEGAGTLAVRHAWNLGHRTFAAVTPPLRNVGHAQRVAGMRCALTELGAPAGALRVFECLDVTSEEGTSIAAQLALAPRRPTALIATNSTLAKGLLRGFAALGVRVPGDVSLLGFEDGSELLDCDPQVTALRQPTRQIGESAARLLIAQIAGDKSAASIRLPFSLSLRASSAPPAGASSPSTDNGANCAS